MLLSCDSVPVVLVVYGRSLAVSPKGSDMITVFMPVQTPSNQQAPHTGLVATNLLRKREKFDLNARIMQKRRNCLNSWRRLIKTSLLSFVLSSQAGMGKSQVLPSSFVPVALHLQQHVVH